MSNLTRSERLENLKGHYSDLHKEVHGFRPRGSWIMASTNPSDIVFIQDEIDRLCVDSERAVSAERSRQAEAVARFEAHVAQLITMGASDRESALRWIHDAEGTEGDVDHLESVWGLPYRYFAEANKAA
jgi:hypothetical protein